MKTKAVRSQRIAWLLRKEGFKILGITPNRRRPNLDVYIFEATPELCTALDHISKIKTTEGITNESKSEGKS